MRRPATKTWALIATLTVATSTIGFSLAGMTPDGRPHLARDDPQASGSDALFGVGPFGLDIEKPPEIVHTPPFPLGDGAIPTKSEALDFPARYSRFIAKGTGGLDELAREGHLTGTGTPDDPYVLERFYVDGDLTIQSTDRALIVREGYVNGQLSLNYVGPMVYVHHVYAKDLRINENIAREGTNTGGLFHDNHFGFVGQIRHFVGAFRANQVGPVPDGVVRDYLSDTGAASLPEGIVFNFDGFHGADVHHNRFHGAVDIKLHGHNHGDCLICPIHDHADDTRLADDEATAAGYEARTSNGSGSGHDARDDAHAEGQDPDGTDDDVHDAHPGTHRKGQPDGAMDLADALGFRTSHSIRYHSLIFRDNEIQVGPGSSFALRYNDRAHAGDDRTAASEPNHFLDDPHVHYQDVALRGNVLKGAPLNVDVFHAEDERHPIQNLGVLRIEDNSIEIPYVRSTERSDTPLHGIDLRKADGITLHITRNTILFQEQKDGLPAATLRTAITYPPRLVGIHMADFRTGEVDVRANHVNEGDLGVHAIRFADDLTWRLVDNDFQTEGAYQAEQTAQGPEGADA